MHKYWSSVAQRSVLMKSMNTLENCWVNSHLPYNSSDYTSRTDLSALLTEISWEKLVLQNQMVTDIACSWSFSQKFGDNSRSLRLIFKIPKMSVMSLLWAESVVETELSWGRYKAPFLLLATCESLEIVTVFSPFFHHTSLSVQPGSARESV